MDLTQVSPTVWQLAFPVGHVHFVRLPDGYALIDTAVPGSAPTILNALTRLGGRSPDLRQIVLTHSHIDHMGSAADLVRATGARVLAGALDAPVISGTAVELEPAYTAPERALHEQIMAGFAEADVRPLQHVPVDVELHDGDTVDDWIRRLPPSGGWRRWRWRRCASRTASRC
ncbi:MBL fold metallo-hydrolase [Micromonospora ureilytica]|uniref:MBL fold metallo-hydrolase n=1 Tax=Micromonospora ureilytica TaxID=709868 RepID=UPI002E163D4D|nr:MBL fold metallo-hydrolase [Micromonospora ureilytica]